MRSDLLDLPDQLEWLENKVNRVSLELLVKLFLSTFILTLLSCMKLVFRTTWT